MRRNLFAVLCALMTFACASRPAAIGEDATYIIEVTNSMPHAMAVSLDMGAAQASVLGEVPAGATRRFEVRNPATNDVLLRAAPADQSHGPVERRVELSRGEVAKVSL